MPIGEFTKLSNVKINGFSDCDQRHIPDAGGRDNSVNMGIFIHAVVPRHVETVVQLVRKKPDTYINVKLDLDELNLTSAEAKATYEEIRNYIREEHGVNVTNLDIAQTKRKCGLEVGEAYNKPKSKDSRQPICTAEKEQLIIEALRHFKMVG